MQIKIHSASRQKKVSKLEKEKEKEKEKIKENLKKELDHVMAKVEYEFYCVEQARKFIKELSKSELKGLMKMMFIGWLLKSRTVEVDGFKEWKVKKSVWVEKNNI